MQRVVTTNDESPRRSPTPQRPSKLFTSSTLVTDKVVSGWLCKTAQAVGMLTRKKFMKRFYHFDKQDGILRVYDKESGS